MDNQELVRYKDEYDNFMKEWAIEGAKWYGSLGFSKSIPNFYLDGIFCPEKWFNNEERILFVLKEPHENPASNIGKGEDSYDEDNQIVKFISKESSNSDPWNGSGFWPRIPAFANCVLDEEKSGYEEIEEKDKRDEILKKIAIINLKKYAGGARADSQESCDTGHFLIHASKFAERLKQQIAYLDPTLIVCCGSDVDNAVRFLSLNKKENKTTYKMVSVCHPSYGRYKDEKYKDSFTNAIKAIRGIPLCNS